MIHLSAIVKMNSEILDLAMKRHFAIKLLNEAEDRLSELRNSVTSDTMRTGLADWISRVCTLYSAAVETIDDEYFDNRYHVSIPVDDENPHWKYINASSPDLQDAFIDQLKTGDLLTLFQTDKDLITSDRYTIDLYVNDTEYKLLMPTDDENPMFILAGIRIVKDGWTQYREYVNI
jgi:hypothetical protein